MQNQKRSDTSRGKADCPAMDQHSSHLLSPYSLDSILLRNRVVMAPMTRARSGSARIPNDLMAEYYSQRATAGLIITEATVISEQGIGWVDSPGIYNESQTEGWKKITGALHDRDCPVFLQLWHCGRASHSSFHNGELPVAPSPVKLNGDYIHTPEGKLPYETPRGLELSEIPGIVEDYLRAAERGKDAGFDGVEIHAANGYLLNQFLESKTNHREDDYGGSLENRLRLLGEVVEAVFQVWPRERVGVRLSPNGVFNDMGSPDYRETYLATAEMLNEMGIGYLHLMDGLAFGFHELGEPMSLADFREVFSHTLMGNCGYNQETAEAAIARGDADLIAIGRPFITNPDLVERYEKGLEIAGDADPQVWSAPTAEGYTDFPRHPES